MVELLIPPVILLAVIGRLVFNSVEAARNCSRYERQQQLIRERTPARLPKIRAFFVAHLGEAPPEALLYPLAEEYLLMEDATFAEWWQAVDHIYTNCGRPTSRPTEANL